MNVLEGYSKAETERLIKEKRDFLKKSFSHVMFIRLRNGGMLFEYRRTDGLGCLSTQVSGQVLVYPSWDGKKFGGYLVAYEKELR